MPNVIEAVAKECFAPNTPCDHVEDLAGRLNAKRASHPAEARRGSSLA